MYQTPTSGDFQRKLATILDEARRNAYADQQRIQVEHAARGLGSSGPLISAVAQAFDQLHANAVERVMSLIADFASRTELTPAELGTSARPVIETIAAEFLARIPTPAASLGPAVQQVRGQYGRQFQQRIDGALRDIEIGFIGGRDVSGSRDQDIQGNAFRLLREIEQATRGSASPVVLAQLSELGMTEDQAQAAFQYLKSKGLIEANFAIRYAARVSAAGHDAIREAENKPNLPSRAFPAITYNYITMTVHSMVGSNVQQGTSNSNIATTQTIGADQFVDSVRNLIVQLDEVKSGLPALIQEQSREILSELRAAADSPLPDTSRLRRGLESLKRILEHAGGHIVAVGALDAIAKLLASLPS